MDSLIYYETRKNWITFCELNWMIKQVHTEVVHINCRHITGQYKQLNKILDVKYII